MRNDAAIVAADYTACLENWGVSLAGVGVGDPSVHSKRIEALLSSIDFRPGPSGERKKLLDLGCGLGFFLDYLEANDLIDKVDYTGVDITDSTLVAARKRWPEKNFELRDVRDQPFPAETFDYGVICGVFTSRCGLSTVQMREFVASTLIATWQAVSVGLSFTMMSKHVDWEREDLFFWPLDDLMDFLKHNLSRHVTLQMNYGLWETTVHVAKRAGELQGRVPEGWLSGS